MDDRKQNKDTRKTIISQFNPRSRFAEEYRIIRTNIQFLSGNQEIQSIVVTSTALGEGKTTTVANLGTVMAQQGKRVLLIDADIRKPELHQFFDLNNDYGLTNILLNNYSLEDVVLSTTVKNLDIICSGPIPSTESDILGSVRMVSFLEKIKDLYEFVLIDSPPIVEKADAQVLANICDGSILVMRSGKTIKNKVTVAKHNLVNSKAKLLGAVLNEKKFKEKAFLA